MASGRKYVRHSYAQTESPQAIGCIFAVLLLIFFLLLYDERFAMNRRKFALELYHDRTGDCLMPELLEEIKLLIATNHAEHYKQGKAFNIFEVQGTLGDEVKICRLLKEFLDPRGSHGQGALLLKLFFSDVLREDSFKDSEYDSARVVREEVIANDRRIDLVIYIAKRVFPIEVKIYADDQENQCKDYYTFAVKKDAKTKIYYLTIDGHEPSEYSRKDLDSDHYRCISFEEDMICWINDCIHAQELEQIYSIREILIQFRDALLILMGKDKGHMRMDIRKKIEASKENFAAALQISQALPEIQEAKMIEFFDAIKAHMEEKGLGKYLDSEAYTVAAKEYYNKKGSSWPSLNYLVPVSNKSVERCIAFRFEIDWRMYFGIVPWNAEDKNNWTEKTRLVEEYVEYYLKPIKDAPKSKYWYWWDFISEDIDFRNCNEEYCRLFDNGGIERAINTIFASLDDVLDELYS